MRATTPLFLAAAGLALAVGCNFSGTTRYEEEERDTFLRDIRPAYFQSMNWENPAVRADASRFESHFADIYDKHEAEFLRGEYRTRKDSSAFGLESLYFGFLVCGNTTSIMDGTLAFDDIVEGNRRYFRETEGAGSEKDEMLARMERSIVILKRSTELLKGDRRALGAYWNARVYADRMRDPGSQSQPATVRGMIDFATETGVDRFTGAAFPNYDLLITLITARFNEDSLFSFPGSAMDTMAEHVRSRLNPNAFLGLSDLSEEELADFNFVAILGPIYRMDVLMRKASWMARAAEPDFESMGRTLAVADSTAAFLDGRLKRLASRWPYKETIEHRKALLQRMREYAAAGQPAGGAELSADAEALFKRKDIRQAYQCYNCHRKATY
jgi:hypothetical protein